MGTRTAKREQFVGLLLGTAVGDAIGLPREGLSRRRAAKLFGDPPLRHALLGRRGMMSDDTEHACMTTQALLASGGDPKRFARSLAWRFRWWLLGLPAGVGAATARALVKLWLGWPAHRSGVWSAGNGPAMRSAILGLYAAGDVPLMRQLVAASTGITHADPAAGQGAMAVALAAAYGAGPGPDGVTGAGFTQFVTEHLGPSEIVDLIARAADAADRQIAPPAFFESCGLAHGVTGYINHTVPAAIFCWLRWPGDFRMAVEQVVVAGGDTDSTGAIVGALVGATAGACAIPQEWVNGLQDWPRSAKWIGRLAEAVAGNVVAGRPTESPPSLLLPAVLLRNLLFLAIVLVHGFRRLLPPY